MGDDRQLRAGGDPFDVGPHTQRLFEFVPLLGPTVHQQAHKLRVRPGSSLAKDNRQCAPMEISTFAAMGIVASLEHIDVLRICLEREGVAHTRAIYTQLRAVLESCATALWLITPTARGERVERALRLGYKSLGNRDRAFEVFDAPNLGAESRLATAADDAARALGLDPISLRKNAPQITRMLGAIENVNAGKERTALWRIASGMAHNDIAMVTSISTVASVDNGDGTMYARMGARAEFVDWMSAAAGLDLSRLLWLLRERGVEWVGAQDLIDQAIDLFPNVEIRDLLERRAARTRAPWRATIR